MRRQLRALMTLLILELWLIISLVWSLPPSSYTLSRSKKKESLVLSVSLFFNIYIYISPFFHAEMTTKFNQEMYTKMKAKKNKPFSSLGKKVVRDVEKGTLITPAIFDLEATRTASPTTSLEELTPHLKRQRTLAKGKEKIGSQVSNV